MDRPEKKGGHKRKGGKGGKGGNDYVTAPDGTKYYDPPFMAYDPAIDAEQRANQRGLEDIRRDFQIQKKVDRQDYRQSTKDIKLSAHRGRQDLQRDKTRTLRDFGDKRSDLRLQRQRGTEDYGTRLADLFRGYGYKARAQMQSANVRGVADAGTLGAAAAKRAENMAVDRQGLDTAYGRQQQDIATSLTRLGTDQSEYLRDTRRAGRRLGQDTQHDLTLAGRDFQRTRRSSRQTLKRAEREALFSDVDLQQQKIWSARQLKPNAFNRYGKKSGGK